jgi:hypothetical protein
MSSANVNVTVRDILLLHIIDGDKPPMMKAFSSGGRYSVISGDTEATMHPERGSGSCGVNAFFVNAAMPWRRRHRPCVPPIIPSSGRQHRGDAAMLWQMGSENASCYRYIQRIHRERIAYHAWAI